MLGVRGLFVPGPTNVPETVRKAIDIPDGRSPRTRSARIHAAAVCRSEADLQDRDAARSSSSPPPAPAAGKRRSPTPCRPATRVLAARFGQFSHLWIDLCERHGLDVDVGRRRVGRRRAGRNLRRQKFAADTEHKIKAVLVCQNETATGVSPTSPPCAPRSTPPATLPCCSSTASARSPASTSAWTSGASTSPCPARRRASCCRPASPSSASARRRWKPASSARLHRCYFDFADMIATNAQGYFPYTPPMT